MKFIKNVIIYESPKVRIYINQCYNPGKKTKLFAVRRDDKTGLADLLGLIRFSGGWRQYVLEPTENTRWCAQCQESIASFCREQTKKWRLKNV